MNSTGLCIRSETKMHFLLNSIKNELKNGYRVLEKWIMLQERVEKFL